MSRGRMRINSQLASGASVAEAQRLLRSCGFSACEGRIGGGKVQLPLGEAQNWRGSAPGKLVRSPGCCFGRPLRLVSFSEASIRRQRRDRSWSVGYFPVLVAVAASVCHGALRADLLHQSYWCSGCWLGRAFRPRRTRHRAMPQISPRPVRRGQHHGRRACQASPFCGP
jgi:hypothetical protein